MKEKKLNKPNVIFILADDLGYSDIGCFGSEINTPYLDSLGKNGIMMTQMYNSARCCPSRASLLTGLTPHQAGVGHMVENLGTHNYQGYLSDNCVTIAECLSETGYQTFMSGKWHVGGHEDIQKVEKWRPGEKGFPTPKQRGFDKFDIFGGYSSSSGRIFRLSGAFCIDSVSFHPKISPGGRFWAKTK